MIEQNNETSIAIALSPVGHVYIHSGSEQQESLLFSTVEKIYSLF